MHSRRMLTRGFVWFDHGSRRGRARRGEAGGPARSAVWRTLARHERAGPTPGRGALPTRGAPIGGRGDAPGPPAARVCACRHSATAPRRHSATSPLRARAATHTVVPVFLSQLHESFPLLGFSVANQNCRVPIARSVVSSRFMIACMRWDDYGCLFIFTWILSKDILLFYLNTECLTGTFLIITSVLVGLRACAVTP